jgi:hypothetical protein
MSTPDLLPCRLCGKVPETSSRKSEGQCLYVYHWNYDKDCSITIEAIDSIGLWNRLNAQPGPTAPQQSGEDARDAARYRLLSDGELIQAGDECLQDDAVTWLAATHVFFGLEFRRGGILRTMRRQIDAASSKGVDGE